MDTSDNQKDNTYIFDSESPAELARLINLDRMVTKAMGGPLAEQAATTLAKVHDVLDLACGPGSWVLDVAFLHPKVEVCGVDVSRGMVNYANARAQSQNLKNASFGVMDITKPLDFPSASFDLVNARALIGVLSRTNWISFIAECMRILRKGGILRLTEGIDPGITNSSAYQAGCLRTAHTLWQAGYGFSIDGMSFDMTYILPKLLREAGYQDVHFVSHALEVSAGTEAWNDFYHNANVGSQLARPFLLALGASTAEELEREYHQMLIDMNGADFCGMMHYMTFWGSKP